MHKLCATQRASVLLPESNNFYACAKRMSIKQIAKKWGGGGGKLVYKRLPQRTFTELNNYCACSNVGE